MSNVHLFKAMGKAQAWLVVKSMPATAREEELFRHNKVIMDQIVAVSKAQAAAVK